MSILIKGIDLPKGARYADISFLDKFGIPVGHGYIEEAIQIDRPHGRLIDGGWAKYNLENYSDLPTKYLHMDLVREAIEDAPTILEAEE